MKTLRPPKLILSTGAAESLKWLGLALMTVDHVNKYLVHDAFPILFAAGRGAMPIFSFVLGYNLARPDALKRGVYRRVAARLALFGMIASVPFSSLGGLGWGWWPLNILGTLLTATVCAWLLDLGGRWRVALAIAVFAVGGSSVEFWWPGVALCLCAWSYCRRPSWWLAVAWLAANASLYVINRNLWALAALPLIVVAANVDVRLPRTRHWFYAYYPAHLAVLWLLSRFW